jgi:hypothetical protein
MMTPEREKEIRGYTWPGIGGYTTDPQLLALGLIHLEAEIDRLRVENKNLQKKLRNICELFAQRSKWVRDFMTENEKLEERK